MQLKELYSQIENPVDNDKKMEVIIRFFLQHGSMTDLTHLIGSTHTYDYDEGRDKFLSFMFNTWKDNIINMDDDKIKELLLQGRIEKDFLILRDFLSIVDDVREKEEIYSLYAELYNTRRYKKILCAFNKYYYQFCNVWNNITSSRFLINMDNMEGGCLQDIEHRLYINANDDGFYEIMLLYVQKCLKYNIPFDFKYPSMNDYEDDFDERDDSLVIYTNTKFLVENVEILREIAKENPELMGKMNMPPIATGYIDGWIGYGSEPAFDGISHTSYNIKRKEVLSRVILIALNEWHEKKTGIRLPQDYNVREQILLSLAKMRPLPRSLIKCVQDKIKEYSLNYNIDPDNFSFDMDKKELMLKEPNIVVKKYGKKEF